MIGLFFWIEKDQKIFEFAYSWLQAKILHGQLEYSLQGGRGLFHSTLQSIDLQKCATFSFNLLNKIKMPPIYKNQIN